MERKKQFSIARDEFAFCFANFFVVTLKFN